DRIIEVTEDIFTQARSKNEAETIARLALSMIEDEAKRVVEESGFDYPVTVTLGQEDYPERDYEGLKFPAGEYLSLRVLIGDAEGQNWWCVLFPPICLRAASRDQRDTEEAFIAAGLTGEQYRIITESGSGRYKIKFKILEIISELFG
ncbi:MAG: stage II sporulation protein R, partial [Clostridia bacterium]|nr:stage II sporulation protein R [Clostridia bacterium]